MGASSSKLVFKKGIFRLSEERHIPADDPYWTSVSPLPRDKQRMKSKAMQLLGPAAYPSSLFFDHDIAIYLDNCSLRRP